MSAWLERFNQMSAPDASRQILACCDSRGWARAVARQRPYSLSGDLLAAADAEWWRMPPAEWLHAFAAHPRIGENAAARPQHGSGDRWSANEQQGAAEAADSLKAGLADLNHEYENRFGFTYIVCASGRNGEEMVRLARERLANDPETELRIAAAEQAQIMKLRLQRLLHSDNEEGRVA